MDELSINQISDSLEKSLQSDLKDLTAEQIDKLADQLFDSPLAELPWIGSVVKGLKFVKSVRESLFNKKVLHFLVEASKGDEGKMKETIAEINGNPEHEQKFGESAIMIIDQFSSITQAKLMGRCLKYLNRKDIDFDDYTKLCFVILQISPTDIKLLSKLTAMDRYVNYVSSEINYKLLETLGLVTVEYDLTRPINRMFSSDRGHSDVKVGANNGDKKTTWLGKIFHYILLDKEFDKDIEWYRPAKNQDKRRV